LESFDSAGDMEDMPKEIVDLIKKIKEQFLSSVKPIMDPMTERDKIAARISIAKQVSKQMGIDIPPDNIDIIDGMKFETE
jgi:hypothetical protein